MGLSITNALEWTYADGGGHTCTLVLKEPNDSNHPTDQIVFLNSFFFFLEFPWGQCPGGKYLFFGGRFNWFKAS